MHDELRRLRSCAPRVDDSGGEGAGICGISGAEDGGLSAGIAMLCGAPFNTAGTELFACGGWLSSRPLSSGNAATPLLTNGIDSAGSSALSPVSIRVSW